MPAKTSQQFLLFTGVGAIGTVGHFTTLIFLVQFMGITPVVATTIGFIVGAVINYLLNYRITFNSKKRHLEALTKFSLVAGFGAILNAAIMALGIKLFDTHYLFIQAVATGCVLVFNFIANKYWTFAGSQY